MIIKYYTYLPNNNDGHGPVAPDLIIIENCENVVVHGGIFGSNDTGPDINRSQIQNFLDNGDYIMQDLPPKKLITFAKGGFVQRLEVYGTAYVCNDDGKTVEKVSIS